MMDATDLTANMSRCEDAANWAEDVNANEEFAMFVYDRLKSQVATFHRCGFAHGDIKPENIFLSSADIVHLLDLGLTSRLGEPFSGCGTIDYMPFELLLSSEKAIVKTSHDW